MTGSHTDSYCMTTSFLPPTCSLCLWFSQQHWLKHCCPSLVQWNINRKTEKKLDQTPASLINDILMKLSTLHYLKGLWWQWECSTRVYYLGDQSRADIRQWVEWQLCPGDKWTRVRHRGTRACGEGDTGADGSHLASSLPPCTDPLSKNEKMFPHPWPRDYPHLFS